MCAFSLLVLVPHKLRVKTARRHQCLQLLGLVMWGLTGGNCIKTVLHKPCCAQMLLLQAVLLLADVLHCTCKLIMPRAMLAH